jgi:hypothetical protein
MLNHIVNKKYLKSDIPLLNPKYNASSDEQDGGIVLNTEGNSVLLIYTKKTDYAKIPDAGPIIMGVYSKTTFSNFLFASPNIQCDNGVVHSLSYKYSFGKI